MALNFPDPATQTPVNTWSPTSTPSASTNGLTYAWDGEKWSTAAAAFEDIYVSKEGDVMTGNLTVPSLNGGPLAGLRNRFINGSFDVWQRSHDVTSAGSAYKTADRWYIETNGVNTVSKRIDIDNTTNALKDEAPTTYGMRLHANGSPLEVRQCIELTKTGAAQDFPVGSQWWVTWYSDLRNGSTGNDGTFINCRVAFMDNASDAGANTETIGPLTNLGGRRWGFPITIATAPPSTATCLRIDLITGNVNEFEFTALQLEPGPVATVFEQRPIGTELALCQRYYQKRDGRWDCYENGGKYVVTVDYPVSMRTLPTISDVVSPGFTPTNQIGYLDHAWFEGTQAGIPKVNSFTADAEL